MNISIWDLDWFYKKTTIPNVNCMRLSSYHKQKGDNINFISQNTHLSMAYDVMYIAKELDITPLPSRKYIDDNRVTLIGKGFKYFNTKEVSPVIIACRPDYLLYETTENNSYTNANFITFFAGNKLIKNRQNFHNTKLYKKRTIVTDAYLWKATDEEIIYCLEVLKDEKNIVFLEPISLSRILNSKIIRKNFLELHFGTATIFKWKNDYSSDYTKIDNIISFLNDLKQVTKSNLGFIPIKAITSNHYDNDNFENDWYRCMQIIKKFKLNKLQCVVIAPKEVLSTPFYMYIKQLEIWTRYCIKLSYIEFILHNTCAEQGILWYNILNNPIKWQTKEIDFLLYLLTDNKWYNIKDTLITQWGSDILNFNLVNLETIKNNITLIYKDTKNE